MSDGVMLVVSAFLFLLVVLLARHTCRPGWSVDGVRPTGWTVCRPAPPPHCGEPVPPDDGPCPQDPRTEPLFIYCTGGAHPIVVNERTVGCQR